MVELNELSASRHDGAETAEDEFASLVKRHINLVFSSALRQVRDPHTAEEVVQAVFERLARKRGSLGREIILAGWLYRTTRFVSLERLRSDHRRQLRETAAMETLYQSQDESHWHEIEPMLDEAMAELGEKERALVLLRYFENKSLREVGNVCGITEDAAQKRVCRALEKLRAFFTQRGTTLSATTLTGTLSTFAVQAAPSALVPLVITAGAASSAYSIGSAALGVFHFMASTKIKATIIAAAFLAASSVPIVTQHRALKQARAENENLRSQVQQLEARPLPTARVRDESGELEQLRREAAEVHKLRGQVGLLLNANRELTEKNPAAELANDDPAKTNPTERMSVARELRAQGKNAEALEHYLWCFDEGLKYSPAFVGVRSSFLLSELRELAKVHPPALEALVTRRNAVEERIMAGSMDKMSVYEMIQLNANLEQPERTMALFDQLPEGHPARSSLVDFASEQFASAKRYRDIVTSGNPEATFDRERAMMGHTAGKDEMLQTAIRQRVIEAGARGVEALAGAGENQRATALADKLLKFDSSPQVRGALTKHAERAGNADVIAYVKNK
jgi:RNA polymerase sigma factor (sigma-70 family)